MKILTLNVHGLRNRRKRLGLFHWLNKHEYDVILLQETYIINEDIVRWSSEWSGPFYAVPGTNHSKGNIILINKKCLADNLKHTQVDTRTNIVEFRHNELDFYIINCYAPNIDADKIQYFSKIRDLIKDKNEESCNLIVGGDFNALLSDQLDNLAGGKYPSNVVKHFNTMVNNCDIVDVWRSLHPREKCFTWKRNISSLSRRLDYVFTNETCTEHIKCSEITPFSSSDHDGVTVVLDFEKIERGPGIFKMNNSILREQEYVDTINLLLDSTIEQYSQVVNPQVFWELSKTLIRQSTVNYCKSRALEHRDMLNIIENDLKTAQENIVLNPQNTIAHAKYNECKKKHEIHLQEVAKGAQLRSKIKWLELGEKNTSYFLSLEKYKGKQKLITSVKKDTGEKLTKNKDIGDQIYSHYQNFCQKKLTPTTDNDFETFLRNVNVPQLTADQLNSCEGNLLIEETTKVLRQMKNDSCPGSDGISTAFYKVFWNKIKRYVTESLNYSNMQSDNLSLTQRSAIVTLIHKGKDLPKDELSNYRPISLTNVDYKIGAKALASRLQNVLTSLISPSQSAYLKGRKISENIRLIDDVLWYTRQREINGILLAVDFSKAFDSLDKGFLLKTLHKFNFGPQFIKWITVFITKTRSAVSYNGWLTNYFDVERGIRQGCPLSALLFILCLELLTQKIEQSRLIKGVVIPEPYCEIKITQYADDNTLFLQDVESLEAALNTIDQFGAVSGLHINRQKTEAMWLGGWRNRTDQYHDIRWKLSPNSKIKILGVFFDNQCEASKIEENWQIRMNKMENLVKQWKKRKLSIIGRVTIVKALLVSQINYLFQSLTPPDRVLSQMNSLIYTFVWGGSEKVKRKILIQEEAKGGLKMPDMFNILSATQLTIAKQLIYAKSPWSIIPNKILNTKHGGEWIVLKYNADLKTINNCHAQHLNKLPIFYKSLVRTIYKYKTINSETKLNDVIWNNENIRYKRKCLYKYNWIKKGILYLSDVIEENGDIKSYHSLSGKVGDSASSMMYYNVIVNAIKSLRLTPGLNYGISINKTNIYKLDSRRFNRYITSQEAPEPVCQHTWENIFSTHINWTKIWMMPYLATNDTKCREIQWKIIHRIYPTNTYLCRIRIRDRDLCEQCNLPDTLEHFFVTCTTVLDLWKYIEDIVSVYYSKHIGLTAKDKILGYSVDGSEEKFALLNKLIIVAKVTISKFKKSTYPNLLYLFELECRLRHLDTKIM